MLRTQICRPALCGKGCEIIQEWDDNFPEQIPRNVGFRRRCSRHAHLSEVETFAAIVEQDRLESIVWSAVRKEIGIQESELDDPKKLTPDEIASGLRMDSGSFLNVDLPISQRQRNLLQKHFVNRLIRLL
jgi:hypothetical protein